MQEFFEHKTQDFIQWLNFQWNIQFDCVRQDFDIQGSPERTLSRIVIQDKNNNLFLLEKFADNKFKLRSNVAKAIHYLNHNGLKEALPCIRSGKGEFLPFFKGSCFQLTSFITGTQIKRPDYLGSKVMGKNFAQFLIGLAKASGNIEETVSFTPFSIKDYVYQIFKTMKIHDKHIYEKYLPFLTFLEKDFMNKHDSMELLFCHGDLHPINVIWDHENIKAVIDWEFTGIKPDIYDAANLVGCAGIEDPKGLGMPMVMTFLQVLKESNIISKKGWEIFPEYILALRFAWLSEWLRNKDEEMLEMEEVYMKILMDNVNELRKIWEI